MIGFLIATGVLMLVVAVIVIPILWFRRCKHKYYVMRTIHGDERLHRNKTRVLSCGKCGKVKYE